LLRKVAVIGPGVSGNGSPSVYADVVAGILERRADVADERDLRVLVVGRRREEQLVALVVDRMVDVRELRMSIMKLSK
jgi:hypothetical protein